MHNIYDLNQAYEGFVKRFSIEPNGLLMHESTYEMLKLTMHRDFTVVHPDASVTFRGAPIFRSAQMEINQLRFII